MRKLSILLAVLLLIMPASAETALEYCARLEEILPGADFADADVPTYCIEKLGEDYDFAARSSDRYGSYIAGVRKTPVPEGAKVDSFSGSFQQKVWRVSDGDNHILYNFALSDNVDIHAFDGMQHLIITADPANYPDLVLQSASSNREYILYSNAHGFDLRDESRPQLDVRVHNYESWKAGATIEPTTFYINVETPVRVLGEKSMSLEKASRYRRTDVGVWLISGGETYGLVYSADGMKGVEYGDRLYEAGPDFDRLLDMAAETLGYRPGDVDFIGKMPVRAEFEWLAGESAVDGEINSYGAGSVEVTDERKLGVLAQRLKSADYMLGSVNCPSNAFLTLEFDDGTSASMAVAVNSFSTFFYRGLCFDFSEGDIIDLFNLRESVFYKAICGG